MKRKLSPKRLDILELLAEGFDSKQIADKLGNSPSTINVTRQQMIQIFGARNTTHMVAMAIRNGIIK